MTFITTQELEDLYPDLTPKERENAFVKEHGTTFLMKIGGPLKSGKPHDGRAPDYDDWDLNGDMLFWNKALGSALELSSMGIRVSPGSHDRQLKPAGCDDRRTLPFHKAAAERRAALHHRRRHRPEPSVHAAAGQRPHRRSTGKRLGRSHPRGLRKGRHSPAVSKIREKALCQNRQRAFASQLLKSKPTFLFLRRFPPSRQTSQA